jgi:hypothetical protein
VLWERHIFWDNPDLGVRAGGAFVHTPNLSSYFQEVINRPNWASGNSVVAIIVQNPAAEDGERDLQTTFYDGNNARAAWLHANYMFVFSEMPSGGGVLGGAAVDSVPESNNTYNEEGSGGILLNGAAIVPAWDAPREETQPPFPRFGRFPKMPRLKIPVMPRFPKFSHS